MAENRYEHEAGNTPSYATGSGTAASYMLTVAASEFIRWGVLAFSGYSRAQNFTVEILIDNEVVWGQFGSAGTTTGMVFDSHKIIYGDNNESLKVRVTPAASDACGVNVAYMQV